MKVAHIITGLNCGGAERMLQKLLCAIDREHFECAVISLSDIGSIGQEIADSGIPVYAIDMSGPASIPSAMFRLSRILSDLRPDIVHTWLYHADLLGGIVARLCCKAPVIWSIRSLMRDRSRVKRGTLAVRKVCAWLSRVVPSKITCNSYEAIRVHCIVGYCKGRMMFIPNGFDTNCFKPDPQARLSVRSELGLSENAPIIGLIARFDPNKDHETFIKMAALVAQRVPEARFLLCGDMVTWENDVLAGWVDSAGIRDRICMLGPRTDIPRLTAALDVSVLTSRSEAFPNVVGEAMACGVLCVVTDVGDAARIVGDMGRVVPPGDYRALADACCESLAMPERDANEVREKSRNHILSNFSIDSVADQYEILYKELTN